MSSDEDTRTPPASYIVCVCCTHMKHISSVLVSVPGARYWNMSRGLRTSCSLYLCPLEETVGKVSPNSPHHYTGKKVLCLKGAWSKPFIFLAPVEPNERRKYLVYKPLWPGTLVVMSTFIFTSQLWEKLAPMLWGHASNPLERPMLWDLRLPANSQYQRASHENKPSWEWILQLIILSNDCNSWKTLNQNHPVVTPNFLTHRNWDNTKYLLLF